MKDEKCKEQILNMIEARTQEGVPPLSDDEILAHWQRIRDGALEWMLQSVKLATGKGTKEAEQMYNTACRHIDNIERKRENLR